ncbi:MAG: cation-translocating P-type ATPase [Firmicutes bacterium]|nr:cation-translocating P-type ATPase [Bacillota bacterium]
MRSAPHATPVSEVLSVYGTDPARGISNEEARARLERFGPNEIREARARSLLTMLLGQLKDFLVIILIVSAAISVSLGETLDALVIIAIVILNAIIGLLQERRAERALSALKKMAAPTATVIRDGEPLKVSAASIVPGDIVVLQAGDLVPADMRLLEAVNMSVDEAVLTGESMPVEKNAGIVVDAGSTLGDRVNMTYLATTVTYGRGRGIVTATGMETEIGKIAGLIETEEDEQTPLQRKLGRFGKWLGGASLGICAIVFILGLLRGERPFEMFMTAVSLAVAAIPEGLPAIVTVVLAIGVQRMIARNAIIRRLPAVETLGSATFVCTDKTGTLTENKMTVKEIYLPGGVVVNVTGTGYQPAGEFLENGRRIDPAARDDLRLLLMIGCACNDASLIEDRDVEDRDIGGRDGGGDGSRDGNKDGSRDGSKDGSRDCGKDRGSVGWRYKIAGDPTEGALVVLAAKAGMTRDKIDRMAPRVHEIPFDSQRKRMTTINVVDGQYQVFSKGAPDVLLSLCDRYVDGKAVAQLTEAKRAVILEVVRRMAGAGLRVLGMAYRTLDKLQLPGGKLPERLEPDAIERELIFAGMVGMIDPVRDEARDAVRKCREAGIRPVIVTGDYALTAKVIGEDLGILDGSARILTGAELERMSDDELREVAGDVSVYARVSPEYKLRIVEALKARGEVVAMTGDGVNDAPALHRADIGIAMGITGTDVAKGASDMVLTDDNFASIVAAIEQGRTIFENIRKFVIYLLSCNIGELLLFLIAIISGLPRPLTPVQILLVNLVTDGLPALALGMEPVEPGIMRLPPRNPREGILTPRITARLVLVGLFIAGAVLVPFAVALRRGIPVETARTMAFITLGFGELWRALGARSERRFVWNMPLFTNPPLISAIAASALLIMLSMTVPWLARLFRMVTLTSREWEVVLGATMIPLAGAELLKALQIRGRARQPGRRGGSRD